MGRAASDATLLRHAKAEEKRLRLLVAAVQAQRDEYRARATKAEMECEEWKSRFDNLLRRTPEVK
jgi:FtsZ-binding cell division protein ZapB